MKKLTKNKLEEMSPCRDGFRWWCKNCDGLETIEQIKMLNSDKCPDSDWAKWLIVRVMNKKQYQAYAVYAAIQVLDNYESKYNSVEPREAIIAAIKVIKRDTKANRSAASAAARAASDAARAASAAASDAARSARSAAWSAESAASSAESAESAAWYAARSAAWSAAWSAASSARSAAGSDMKRKIIDYGIKLLEGSENPRDVGKYLYEN